MTRKYQSNIEKKYFTMSDYNKFAPDNILDEKTKKNILVAISEFIDNADLNNKLATKAELKQSKVK